jgi:hypothetical protein
MDGNRRLGVVSLALALGLTFIAIPWFVSSPSNVRNIILSPTFWPYVLSGFLAVSGLLLLLFPSTIAEPEDAVHEALPGAGFRLFAIAAIMVLTMILLPRLGMVWTSMLAFAASAFLYRTRHPRTAIVCAILVPLVLYAFFAHVAGVAIPQGNFVRLP